MRKILVFVTFMLFFLLCITGCEEKIDLDEEYDEIMEVAEDLVIEDFEEEKMDFIRKLIVDSVKVHTVTEIEDEVYILYSYNFNITESEDEFLSDKFYEMGLEVIKKDSSKYGYRLAGGGGGGGDLQTTPLTRQGTNNKIYGLIQDERISNLQVEYVDGKTISYDTTDKDYYLIVREDTEELINSKITAFDKEGNEVFKFE